MIGDMRRIEIFARGEEERPVVVTFGES